METAGRSTKKKGELEGRHLRLQDIISAAYRSAASHTAL
jgi:hypothetical protein